MGGNRRKTRSYARINGISLVVAFGLGFLVYSGSILGIDPREKLIVKAQTEVPRFRLLNGSFMGDNATYTFQTPPEEKNYAEDCIGCKQEVGNAVIFAEFGCPKKTQYLFDSTSEGGVIEKSVVVDKNGSTIGERRIHLFEDKEKGKIFGARIFWTEGNDFWAAQAPSLEAEKALEKSKEYETVRTNLAAEMKSYVPIHNANTKVKKPC